MLLIDTFVLALKNIWSNKMRTILTMLGIIIGVTAVIVIVGLGNGMTQQVRESFSSMVSERCMPLSTSMSFRSLQVSLIRWRRLEVA